MGSVWRVRAAGILILWALSLAPPLVAQQPGGPPRSGNIAISVIVIQPVPPDTVRAVVRPDTLRVARRAPAPAVSATPLTLVLAYVGN